MTSSCSSSVATEATNNNTKKKKKTTRRQIKKDFTPWEKEKKWISTPNTAEESPLFVPRSLLMDLMHANGSTRKKNSSKRPCTEESQKHPGSATKQHKMKRGRDSLGSIQFHLSPPLPQNFPASETTNTSTTISNMNSAANVSPAETNSTSTRTSRNESDNGKNSTSSPHVFSLLDTTTRSIRHIFNNNLDLSEIRDVSLDNSKDSTPPFLSEAFKAVNLDHPDDMLFSPLENDSHKNTTFSSRKSQKETMMPKSISEEKTFDHINQNQSSFWHKVDQYINKFDKNSTIGYNTNTTTKSPEITTSMNISYNDNISPFSRPAHISHDDSFIIDHKQLLRKELEHTKTALASVRAERDDIERVMMQMQNDYKQRIGHFHNETKKQEQMEVLIQRLQDEHANYKNQLKNTTNKVVWMEMELEIKDRDLANKNKDLENIQIQIQNYQKTQNTNKNENERLQEKVKQIISEKEFFQITIQNQESKIESLSKSLQAKEDEMKHVQSECEKKIQEELFDSHHIKTELETMKKSQKNSENKMVLYEAELEDKDIQLEQKEITLQELRNSLSKGKEARKSILKVKKKLEQEIKEKETKLKDYEKNRKNVSSCTHCRSRLLLKNRNKLLNKPMQKQFENLKESKCDQKIIESKQSEKVEDTGELSVTKSSIVAKSIESGKQNDHTIYKKSEIVALKDEKRIVVHSKEQNYTKELEELKNEIRFLSTENGSLLTKIQMLETSIAQQEQEANAAVKELASHVDQINMLNAENNEKCAASYQKKIEEFETIIDEQNSALLEKEQNISKLNECIQSKEKLFVASTEKYHSLQNVNTSLQCMNDELQEELSRIKNDLKLKTDQKAITEQKPQEVLDNAMTSEEDKGKVDKKADSSDSDDGEIMNFEDKNLLLIEKNKALEDENNNLKYLKSELQSKLDIFESKELQTTSFASELKRRLVRKEKKLQPEAGANMQPNNSLFDDLDNMFKHQKERTQNIQASFVSLQQKFKKQINKDNHKKDEESRNLTEGYMALSGPKISPLLQDALDLIKKQCLDSISWKQNMSAVFQFTENIFFKETNLDFHTRQERFNLMKNQFLNLQQDKEYTFEELNKCVSDLISCLKMKDRETQSRIESIYQANKLYVEELQLYRSKLSSTEGCLEESKSEIIELKSYLENANEELSRSYILKDKLKYDKGNQTDDVLPHSTPNEVTSVITELVEELERTKIEIVQRDDELKYMSEKCQSLELEVVALESSLQSTGLSDDHNFKIYSVENVEGMKKIIEELVAEVEILDCKCKLLESEKKELEDAYLDQEENNLDSRHSETTIEPKHLSFTPSKDSHYENDEIILQKKNLNSDEKFEEEEDPFVLEPSKIELEMTTAILNQLQSDLAESIELNEIFDIQISEATDDIRSLVSELQKRENQYSEDNKEPDVLDHIHDNSLNGNLRRLRTLLDLKGLAQRNSMDHTPSDDLDDKKMGKSISCDEEVSPVAQKSINDSSIHSSRNSLVQGCTESDEPFVSSLHDMVADSSVVLKEALLSFHTQDEFLESDSYDSRLQNITNDSTQ